MVPPPLRPQNNSVRYITLILKESGSNIKLKVTGSKSPTDHPSQSMGVLKAAFSFPTLKVPAYKLLLDASQDHQEMKTGDPAHRRTC